MVALVCTTEDLWGVVGVDCLKMAVVQNGTMELSEQDIHSMQHNMALGTLLTRFYGRKRPERKSFEVNMETRQVVWRRQGGRTEGASKSLESYLAFVWKFSEICSFGHLCAKATCRWWSPVLPPSMKCLNKIGKFYLLNMKNLFFVLWWIGFREKKIITGIIWKRLHE